MRAPWWCGSSSEVRELQLGRALPTDQTFSYSFLHHLDRELFRVVTVSTSVSLRVRGRTDTVFCKYVNILSFRTLRTSK